jgi:hypothetical protein
MKFQRFVEADTGCDLFGGEVIDCISLRRYLESWYWASDGSERITRYKEIAQCIVIFGGSLIKERLCSRHTPQQRLLIEIFRTGSFTIFLTLMSSSYYWHAYINNDFSNGILCTSFETMNQAFLGRCVISHHGKHHP